MGTVNHKPLKAQRPKKKLVKKLEISTNQFKQLSTTMETATGDSAYDIKTRNQKKIGSVDDVELLKLVNNENLDPEVQALLHDQIYHNFVEKVMDPDHGPLPEDLNNEDEFVPNDDSVIEVEDGGSSEEELEEEEANPVKEDEIAEVKLSAAESRAAMLKNVPPHLAAAYKKRFPNFWQIHEGIRLHSGKGYDAEEDPDFEVEEDEDVEGQDQNGDVDGTIEVSDDSSSDEEDEDEMVNDQEIAKLSSKVEDMMIPDESMDEVTLAKSLDTEEKAEVDDEEESDSDDETEANAEPDHLDLIDDKKDMIYDDDVAYEPI